MAQNMLAYWVVTWVTCWYKRGLYQASSQTINDILRCLINTFSYALLVLILQINLNQMDNRGEELYGEVDGCQLLISCDVWSFDFLNLSYIRSDCTDYVTVIYRQHDSCKLHMPNCSDIKHLTVTHWFGHRDVYFTNYLIELYLALKYKKYMQLPADFLRS